EEFVHDYGFSIDDIGFEKEMEKQRQRARDARQQTDSMQVQNDLLTKLEVESTFVGYDNQEINTNISKIIVNNQSVPTATEGDEVLVILNETPFYAESGGQVADHGTIQTEDAILEIKDVKKAP